MKIKAAVMLLILLLLTGQAAYAGDIPESIMLGGHEAMFIGEILSIDTDTMTVKPLTVMMGKIGTDELEVKRFQSYSMYPHSPRKGDYIVALLNDSTTIDETWLFECSSADYRTLAIVNDDSDIALRYQKHINNGDYFEAQRRLDEKAASVAATVQATAAPTPAPVETKALVAAAAMAAGAPKSAPVDWELTVLCILLLFSCLIAALIYRWRKRRTNVR